MDISERRIMVTSLLALQHDRVFSFESEYRCKLRQNTEVLYYYPISGFRVPLPPSQTKKKRKIIVLKTLLLKISDVAHKVNAYSY
jgi:hypothetical protein